MNDVFTPTDFPPHMQRDVELANRSIWSAVYDTHIDNAQLNAIMDSMDWCLLYLLAKRTPEEPVWTYTFTPWLHNKGMTYHGDTTKEET